MYNLKIKKPDGSKVEVSYYNKWDAFTAAIGFYQDTNDDWGIGYLHAAREYITLGRLAAEAFAFVDKGFDILIEDALNPAKEFDTMSRKYLQHDVIYYFTDNNQAAYSPDGVGLIYFDDLDEAQTETGITKVIQTTEKEFEDTYEQG